MILRFLAVFLLIAIPAARADQLTLEEVLRSSAQHAPQILEAIARQKQADARLLSAKGQFDLLFEAESQARPAGYYDGSYIEGRAVQPLTTNGGNVYAGYRVSDGSFASYDGKSVTGRLGEIKAGLVFSLLRDRLTDERRTRITLAERDRELAALDRGAVAIGIQRRAIEAYQQWVAAGLRVQIFRDLLSLATERQVSIEKLVSSGARPAILAVENRQNLIRRQGLLTRAEQDLATQANTLSLYLRDSSGTPVVPDANRLPAKLDSLGFPNKADLSNWRQNRPDLQALRVRVEQVNARIQLARNDLQPRLDFRIEASQDMGAAGFANYGRSQTEAIVGLRFSVPLQQRQPEGRLAEAGAEAEALRLRQRLTEDQITVEINNLHRQVTGAEQLASLAVNEVELAKRMSEAERRRCALGASDVFLVNQREEAAADARVRDVDAYYRVGAGHAELAAALADRERLRLD